MVGRRVCQAVSRLATEPRGRKRERCIPHPKDKARMYQRDNISAPGDEYHSHFEVQPAPQHQSRYPKPKQQQRQ